MASKEPLRQGGGEQRHGSPDTDRRMEDMAAAMKAVCEAAKADKARQEWLEAELAGQTSRANASELEKAALQDRVQQLEVALEEQGTKAALAWRHQQEVARLQEKLGKRSVELLAKDQELSKMRAQLKEAVSEVTALTVHLKDTKEKLVETEAAFAGSKEAHKQDVSELKSRLAKAHGDIAEVETAYKNLRQQAASEIIELRGRLTQMSEKLCDLGGRLNDTNGKLVATLAARTASRDKYNSLAKQLLLLSRSAAAAISSAGGAPAAAAASAATAAALASASNADAQSNFERCLGVEQASSTQQAGPTAAAAAATATAAAAAAVRTGAPTSSGSSKTSALLTAPVHSLQGGTGVQSGRCQPDSPGIAITLAAASDNGNSSIRAPECADLKSSLAFAGLTLNTTAQDSSNLPVGQAGSLTSTGSRRTGSGILSRFRGGGIAAAVAQSFGAILSPRSEARRSSAEKQQQQQRLRLTTDPHEAELLSGTRTIVPCGSVFDNNSVAGLSDGPYLIKAAGHHGQHSWRCDSTDTAGSAAMLPYAYATHATAGSLDCSSNPHSMPAHSLHPNSTTAAFNAAAFAGSRLDGPFQLLSIKAENRQHPEGAVEGAKQAGAAGSSSALNTGEDRFTDCSAADDPADVTSHYVSLLGEEHSE